LENKVQEFRSGPLVPDWVRDAVFYQIFPERFADGDPSNNPINAVPWGSKPTFFNHMGGDLQGILDKLDYLLDLGVNAVYLTPIFWATTNHKYNPYDYYTVDPRFGTRNLLVKLLNTAHKHGIKVVLDGVFNHCGRGFFPFVDVQENRQDSAYEGWFYIDKFPVDAYGTHHYAAHADSRRLPKLNVTNPQARRYLLDVARYWIAEGADGWRLDAAAEVEDHSFWRDLRHVVRHVNPQAYIFGEIWQDSAPWLQGDQFDGTTNYPLRGLILDFFVYRSVCASDFASQLENLFSRYPWSAVEAMYNFLGCHDTARILTLADGDVEKVKLAALFEFACPGVPAVYYGDEIGLKGGNDPDNRRAMPWDEAEWDTELLAFFKSLISIRKRLHPLRWGNWEHLFSLDPANCCVFLRRAADEVVIVAVNNGHESVSLTIPAGQLMLPTETLYYDEVNKRQYYCQSDQLVIPDFPPGRVAFLVPVR
jgi:cyclomaltodextrinase / maltogenic alpha-amylase / neopullulanase